MSKSAERALHVLKALARSDNGMGLMEVASATGLDKTTTSRLLDTLQKQAFIHRDPQSKQYHVGAALLSLAATVSKRHRVLRVVHPFLERLRDLSGETTSFYLRMGDGRVCVDGVEGKLGPVRLLPLGEAAPLHSGTSAKAILAFQPDEEVASILDRLQVTGKHRQELLGKIADIRQQGYYAAVGERMSHIATVSAPVRSATGVHASLTVSGPDDRWTMEAMNEFAPTLKAVAADLSALMEGADMSVYGVG